MKREQMMVAEYHYTNQIPVHLTPIPTVTADLVEHHFSLMFDAASEVHKAQSLTELARGLGNVLYSALSASLELGVQPYPQFQTLNGLIRKTEQAMRVKGNEFSYIPQVIRNQRRCDIYIQRLVKAVSRFAYFTNTEILTTSLEHIITTTCEFSLYLGLPISDVFDEIHNAMRTGVRPDLDPIIYKTIPQ